MKRSCYYIIGMLMPILFLTGCAEEQTSPVSEQENTVQNAGAPQEVYLSAEEDEDVLMIMEEYAETEAFPKLAEFLAAYYQIPEEYLSETRYYYNYIDLNDDGTDEIFAVIIGDYTEVSSGDPAVILWEEGDSFGVVEAFAGVRTPITISDELTNGWHDIVYYEWGGEEEGNRICRYNPQGGYQTELSEVVDELPPFGGTQILSNNLIDDMDKGNYLTLKPGEIE